jgi:hypothetical protein
MMMGVMKVLFVTSAFLAKKRKELAGASAKENYS